MKKTPPAKKKPPAQIVRTVGADRIESRRSSGAERRSATASAAGARIVETETAGVQTLDVVQRGAGNVRQRDLIDENLRAVDFLRGVAFLLYVEAQRILFPLAPSADHRYSESLLDAEAFLRMHLLDHRERLGR